MKKSLLLVASAALVLGLAACNSSTPVDTGSTNTNTEPGPGGDVDVPTVEGQVTFYFTMGEGSVEIPEYCGIFLTGKFTDWAENASDVCVMQRLGDTNTYYGSFAVAEDLTDYEYQLTLGYSAESGAPKVGVNWDYKSDECKAASGESGMDNPTYEIVDGKANIGTHTFSAAPGPVVKVSDFDVSITLAEAVPTWVNLYMPGNLRNSWKCSPELDVMKPSEDRKTWTIHVDNEVTVGTYSIKIIAEYKDCTKFSWGTTILDDGKGENYTLMVLRSAAGSVININAEEGVEAYPADFSNLPDPSKLATVNAQFVISLTDTALPEGVLGLAIKGSFDNWAAANALTITTSATGMVCTYTYENLLEGTYQFGFLSYDDAETLHQVNWYSSAPKNSGNLVVKVTRDVTVYNYTGSLAEGIAAVA
ncbi:MAG: hypothetical protein SPJ49_01285 [Bacilli bacterium]|nr:hypothetical protein [Bacilli bacterium]